MIRRATSPTPIGLTPGHLFRGIRRHATRAFKPVGCIGDVHIRRATFARELQSSCEAALKEVHILLHAYASTPEGPADPCVCSAAFRMAIASMDSNSTGSVGMALGSSWCSRVSLCGVLPRGCKSESVSLTDMWV